MLKNIICAVAILSGLALFTVESQLASYAGMALIGVGLFALGGSSSEDELEEDPDVIDPADRVRNLSKKSDES